jgi:Tripartite tricarboxylate transporter family receptor
MKLPRRTFLHLAAGAAALSGVSRIAWAQAYPSRPVRIIVGFLPGQSADISERLLGQWLSDRLGQSFVIDNRPGVAGITIGTEAVVKAAAATSATLYDRLLNSRHRAGCGDQPRTRTTARRAGRHQWHHGYCQSCRPCRSSARLINLQKACESAT